MHVSSSLSPMTSYSDTWSVVVYAWGYNNFIPFPCLAAARKQSKTFYFVGGFATALGVVGCARVLLKYHYPSPDKVFSLVLPMIRANRCSLWFTAIVRIIFFTMGISEPCKRTVISSLITSHLQVRVLPSKLLRRMGRVWYGWGFSPASVEHFAVLVAQLIYTLSG